MKKSNKIILIILMTAILLMIFATNIFAAKVNINKITDKAEVGGGDEIKKIGSIIFSGITGVGIVLSIVVVAIIGVKYMLGSAEEKAEYKKSMMPYLIGALLVFGASTIATAVYNLAK